VALEECEVILVHKSTIEEQMAKLPDFLRGFMGFIADRVQFLSERLKIFSQKGIKGKIFIADRVQFLSERLKIFSQKGIKGKIAYYILQRDKNGSFDLGRSIASLAEYFGVERPSLSRAISEMVKDGIITFDAGRRTESSLSVGRCVYFCCQQPFSGRCGGVGRVRSDTGTQIDHRRANG
ncbi:Crp-like helix-turn-helix domain, partial [Popillia japonica]